MVLTTARDFKVLALFFFMSAYGMWKQIYAAHAHMLLTFGVSLLWRIFFACKHWNNQGNKLGNKFEKEQLYTPLVFSRVLPK